jgi:hypothetical protein
VRVVHRIDRWLWPYLCRKWVYVAALASLLGIFGMESAFPELADLTPGGIVVWGLFNAGVLVTALCVIESRGRYLRWKGSWGRKAP